MRLLEKLELWTVSFFTLKISADELLMSKRYKLLEVSVMEQNITNLSKSEYIMEGECQTHACASK